MVSSIIAIAHLSKGIVTVIKRHCNASQISSIHRSFLSSNRSFLNFHIGFI